MFQTVNHLTNLSLLKAVSSSSNSDINNFGTSIKDVTATNIINSSINNKIENNNDINIEDTNTITSKFQYKALENVINECLKDL
ncbi:10304_t:CDS:2 [Entrophospora sp. SA101]|nr:10304_t:CDS:2 [Entrophospora sp. SA101]